MFMTLKTITTQTSIIKYRSVKPFKYIYHLIFLCRKLFHRDAYRMAQYPLLTYPWQCASPLLQ